MCILCLVDLDLDQRGIDHVITEIFRVYQDLRAEPGAAGEQDGTVRLSALRADLHTIERRYLDAALRALHHQGPGIALVSEMQDPDEQDDYDAVRLDYPDRTTGHQLWLDLDHAAYDTR